MLTRFTRRALFGLAAALAAAAQAQTDLPAQLDRVASAYAQHRHFMGSVLVAKDGKVLLQKAYGKANVEWDLPNVVDGRFRLGSITKQFTATAILQLVTQSRLSLEDKACKFLDPCPEAWKEINVHQLLNHTSGIPSYTGLPDFRLPRLRRLPLTPVEIAMLSKDKPLEFKPGEKMQYNNTGYVLLGHIIEKASGEKYDEYLKKHIFDPLEMRTTGYDYSDRIIEKRVSGYHRTPNGFRNAEFLDMSLPHAAGSLYSTVEDLYKWDRGLYGDKVLSADMKARMFTPGLNNYAYGWTVEKGGGRLAISHGGGIFGFSTMIQRFPEQNAVVIVLSNVENVNSGQIAKALSSTLFGETADIPAERKEISLSREQLQRYVGRYKLPPFELNVSTEDGKLMVHPAGQPKLQARAEADGKFFVPEVDATLEFKPDASAVTLRQGSRIVEGQRVPD